MSSRLLQVGTATILTLYMVMLGGTWNGVLPPPVQLITLGGLALCTIMWGIIRWRAGWVWHRTPLDLVMVGWGVVFVLSIVANAETWRRSVEALWYMLLYILVWYALADLFSNRFRRQFWLNAVMILGIVQTLFALMQIAAYYTDGGSGFPRPVGTIGNPNSFGTVCVVLVPVVFAAFLNAPHRLARIVMGGYLGVCLAILVATYSRGAWVGGIAAIGVMILFWLLAQGIYSVSTARAWWLSISARQRRLLSVGALISVVLAVGALIFVVYSTTQAGRGSELRTLLWEYAGAMFVRSPLLGEGLFTYGYHLSSFWSIPPNQSHSHPHNLPMLILGELGIAGAIVAIATLVICVRSAAHNWRVLPPRERWPFAGAVAALIGIGVHHLFDTTVMMPAIALLALLILAIVVVPYAPVPLSAPWRRLGHPLGMAFLWTGLLAVGFWQYGLMNQYYTILATVSRDQDYAAASDAMRNVIDSDPMNAAYRRQQAYFLGMVANGDASLIPQAIEAHEVLNEIDPYYAAGFANHAALHWQADNRQQALIIAEQGLAVAPDWSVAADQVAYYRGESPEPPVAEEFVFASNAIMQLLRFILEPELLPQIERN